MRDIYLGHVPSFQRIRSNFRTSLHIREGFMKSTELPRKLWRNEEGQDIAEYAVMPAVILVLVIGTVPFDRRECEQCVLHGWQ